MVSSTLTGLSKKRFTALVQGAVLMTTAFHMGSWMNSSFSPGQYSTERFLTEERTEEVHRVLDEGPTGDCAYIFSSTSLDCEIITSTFFWAGPHPQVSNLDTYQSCASNVNYLEWGVSPASVFCLGGFQNGVCPAGNCLDMIALVNHIAEPDEEVIDAVSDFEANVASINGNVLAFGEDEMAFGEDETNIGAVNGDPLFIGIRGQVFKFEGKSDTWYANLASESVQWNLLFNEFESCPKHENMFVTKASVFLRDSGNQITVGVLNKEKFLPGCAEGTVCLGEGSLGIEINNRVIDSPGVYSLDDNAGRVVIHNTYASCSRKWYDYDISKDELNSAGTRALIDSNSQEAAMDLLFKNKGKMLDPEECQSWLDKRAKNRDLFSQNGSWTTVYIETQDISMHMEYRQADETCDSHLIDAWISKVSPKLLAQEWKGILGETRYPKYHSDGREIESGRELLLIGKKDEHYEVKTPYETMFTARHLFSPHDPLSVDSSVAVE